VFHFNLNKLRQGKVGQAKITIYNGYKHFYSILVSSILSRWVLCFSWI